MTAGISRLGAATFLELTQDPFDVTFGELRLADAPRGRPLSLQHGGTSNWPCHIEEFLASARRYVSSCHDIDRHAQEILQRLLQATKVE